MGEPSILKKLKEFITGIAFKVFIWGIDMSKESYWKLIYEQEVQALKDKPHIIKMGHRPLKKKEK